MKGESLRAWRKLHGWTQYDLARVTGFNRSKISEIENGHYNLTPEEETTLLAGIAKLFDKVE